MTDDNRTPDGRPYYLFADGWLSVKNFDNDTEEKAVVAHIGHPVGPNMYLAATLRLDEAIAFRDALNDAIEYVQEWNRTKDEGKNE
jgi:hypothetical protein